MVISVLAGGLGNQLFQYALGFKVSQQLQTELRLEHRLLESQIVARLRNYTPRQYELDIFGIPPIKASVYDTLRCLSRTLLPGRQAVLLHESARSTQMYFDEQTKDALCFGYWQSEEYFKPEADALRKQLIFKKPLTNQTVAVAESIMRGNNATFVHIRRGDYINNLKANQHHGVCDKTYYQRSVEHVRQRVSGPQFFVFSDDLDWVKQELGDLFPAATFVNHNKGADSWQDMYLMSLCRHAIVANSSFSWWGAWLNPVTDRVVTAPRQWFANQSPSNERIAPSFWTRL